MISISFLHKLFVITTIIFIINSSVVLTSCNVFNSLFITPKVYQMLKKDNYYFQCNGYHENYMKSTMNVTYEKKLKINEYYNTIHNFDHIRIPIPSDSNHDVYKQRLNSYCNDDFITYQHFRFGEVKTNDDDRKKCKKQIEPMNLESYSRTKLFYPIFTEVSELNSYSNYVSKRNKTLIDLRKTDKRNSRFYKDIIERIEKAKDEDLKNMIFRRSMEGENYIAYCMRMNLREFLPLPKELWFKEKSIINRKDLVQFKNDELSTDLKNN